MSTATDKAWERFKTNMAPLNIDPASSELASCEPQAQSARCSVAVGSERLWQALQLKADMFDYLCWLDGMHGPESLHGVDRLCMASDGTTCWGKSYADAVRVAMEHDKEIFDAMEAASPNNLLGRSADDKK